VALVLLCGKFDHCIAGQQYVEAVNGHVEVVSGLK